MSVTFPNHLNLSEALFIPPEADKYVETVLEYWDYAFAMADKDYLGEPYQSIEVEEAHRILDEEYPQVSSAVSRVIIARSLKRDLK